MDMTKLFSVQRPIGFLNNSCQLPIVGSSGNHSGGIAVATVCILNAPVTIQ
ncbi:hypothetical protein ACFPES_17335 [Paenibacillus sp. GCM10023248]|nr:hypothetical protein [Paenibacillus sp. MAHUQ-63]